MLATFLLEIFMEMGPIMSGGMGPAPLTFTEILAWQRCSGVALAPWVAKAMRVLSFTYIGESHAAEDPAADAPWVAPAVAPHELQSVGESMRETLRRMAGKGR